MARAVRVPTIPLAAIAELSEVDGLVMENPRATFRAQSGGTLIGAGPKYAPSRALGVTLALQPGDRLADKYDVQGLIGSGNESVVMSALHRDFGSEVALKFFDPALVDPTEASRRFAILCENAGKLRSDFIVRVFETARCSDGQPFLVMEKLTGCDLRAELAERGRLSVERAAKLALQACEALATAHAIGITHQRLKPEKLFLTKLAAQEQVKLLDLGSGHERHASSHRVPTVNAGSVPLYMSPEQMRGAVQADPRSDIWSLGCVLFEMLTGSPLFLRASLAEACVAVLEQATPLPRALRAEIPVGLEDVVLRCLQKRSEDRFNNVVEVAFSLVPFAPADAQAHAERCSQIFEEHGLLRGRARQTSPARPSSGAPAAASPAAPEGFVAEPSRLVEDTLRVPAQSAPARPRERSWQGPLVVVLFLLGSYLALHPSPRAAHRTAPARPTVTQLSGSESSAGPEAHSESCDNASSVSCAQQPLP